MSVMRVTKTHCLVAGCATTFLLSAAQSLEGTPKPWLPLPIHWLVSAIVLYGFPWPIRLLLVFSLVPFVYFLSLRAIWDSQRFERIVLATSLAFAALSLLYFASSWSLGLRYQGYTHTLIVAVENLLGIAIVIALAWTGLRHGARQRSAVAYFAMFTMLSWCAFPYLGEMI